MSGTYFRFGSATANLARARSQGDTCAVCGDSVHPARETVITADLENGPVTEYVFHQGCFERISAGWELPREVADE